MSEQKQKYRIYYELHHFTKGETAIYQDPEGKETLMFCADAGTVVPVNKPPQAEAGSVKERDETEAPADRKTRAADEEVTPPGENPRSKPVRRAKKKVSRKQPAAS